MNVLVTGGAGYIGSHTTVELIEAGHDAVVTDSLVNADMTCVEGARRIVGRDIPFEQADCCDAAAMDELFKKYRFDAAIHFAALKAVGESVGKPLEYYRNNLDSLMTLLETMRRHGVRNVVFSSSCTVYGQADDLPVTERTPRKEGSSPYGKSKQMCETVLEDVVAACGDLRAVALRYFNPVGAHPSALIGELPRGTPNNLLPFITQTAAGIREQLSIFGNDYDTPDGTNLRDYIDVVDLAQAHVAALERMNGGRGKSAFEVFNIGTGRAVSVLELVRRFEIVNELKINYKIAGRRIGDIVAVWADTTYANRELGWQARRSLDDTLASAWKWEKAIRGM